MDMTSQTLLTHHQTNSTIGFFNISQSIIFLYKKYGFMRLKAHYLWKLLQIPLTKWEEIMWIKTFTLTHCGLTLWVHKSTGFK